MSTPYGPGGDPQQQWPPQQPGPGYGAPGPGQGGYAQPGQPGQQFGPPPGQPGQPPYGQPGQPGPGYGPPPGQPGQPPYGQPGQYTPPGGYPGGPPPEKKSAMPWILLVVGIVVIAGAVVGVLFATGVLAGEDQFDNAAVEDGVRGVLTDSYNLENVSDVSCPAGEKVETGHTFDCTATVDGEEKTVLITVKSDDGEYEVAQPG